MKLFYFSMFLIIFIIPFIFFPSKNIKTDQVEIVDSFSELEKKDTLNLFEINNGEEEEFFMPFDGGHINEAYFKKDTIQLRLAGGSYGGYFLDLTIIENEFTSLLQQSSCTWHREMKIKNQFLKIERPRLVDKEKLRAYIFCEAENLVKNNFPEKVKIKGYFEMEMLEVSNY